MRGVRPHHILIPLLALCAVLPLLVHGCSCGHDLSFHVQSWLEAAQQFRHGTLYPHWAFSPAWQAGEPRFVFYPPLSWMLGAVLVLVFPINWTPIVFIWIVLTCAGFSMHRLAREFAPEEAAFLAAAVYLANPYMMLNAFERGAFAELLASVWIPLLFLAMLRERPTVRAIAIPLGLTWLTNAPAGVMATYTVALLALVRLLTTAWKNRQQANTEADRNLLQMAFTFISGFGLGLGLVGFYLLPAAYERKYVQVDMAILPNLRYQDNFLFTRTEDIPHNEVTLSVSVLALCMLLAAFAFLACGFLLRRKRTDKETTTSYFTGGVQLALLILTAVIGILLFGVSTPIWEYLPNLKFLQFPWRLLTLLSVVAALGLASVFDRLNRRRMPFWIAAAAFVLVLSQGASHLYRQGCEVSDLPGFSKYAFDTGHGVLPTDEYTPAGVDNDMERSNNPGYWLTSGDPNSYAPGTYPNPNEITPNYDVIVPFEDTVASRAPRHLELTLPQPETLILNLRDYPAWRVTRNGTELPDHIHRKDGLVALALPAGSSTIDIHWQRLPDQNAGLALSACALVTLGFTFRRSRKINN